MLPLAVVVIAFFLPAAKDCESVVSPADLSLQSIGWFGWLGPTYLGAGFLLATILLARAGRRPPANAIGAIALAAVIGACGFVSVAFLLGAKDSLMGLGAVAAFGSSVVCAVRARRRTGWMRFAAIADGWLLGSAPVAAVNLAAGRYYGAYVFLLAFGSLLALRAVTWAAMFRAKCEWESLARQDTQAPSLRA